MTKLLFPPLQETTWLVFWSSTSSYVLVRKGVGPTSWSPSIGLAMDGSPEFSGPSPGNSSFTKPGGFMIQTEQMSWESQKRNRECRSVQILVFWKGLWLLWDFLDGFWIYRKGKFSRTRKVQFDRWRSCKKKTQKLELKDEAPEHQNKSFIIGEGNLEIVMAVVIREEKSE